MDGSSNLKYINDPGYEVPENTIVVVGSNSFHPNNPNPHDFYKNIIEPLAGSPKRDWFNHHFYYCLPINIGNQYGFAVKSLWDFDATWDGSSENDKDITINMISEDYDAGKQYIGSGFSEGVLTIQNPFHFKTPPGVNLMTIQPPNYGIPGTYAMTGVIESDNLRRDFTFNLKLTDPNRTISVRKGDWLGAFIPIPRYFVDSFTIKPATECFSDDVIINEIKDGEELSRQRNNDDLEKPHQSGRKYFNGQHAYGCPYPDHQKRVPQVSKSVSQEIHLEDHEPSSELSKPPRLFRH